MKKNVFGRQFGRDTGERKALFKGLASSLVLHERIQTTEQKAKSVKGHVEKLVTKAKKGDQNAERLIKPFLNDQAVMKMMQDIAPRFKSRPGGYTRIIRVGKRLQDNASLVILEWVEKPAVVVSAPAKKSSKLVSRLSKGKEGIQEVKEATAKTEKPQTKKTKTTKKSAKEKKK